MASTEKPTGCARALGRERVAPAAGLLQATRRPVECAECGAVFGRGADAGTVCPFCAGALAPSGPPSPGTAA